MFDAAAIAGYLAAALGGAGSRWVDENLDRAFGALTELVTAKLGGRAVADLARNTDSVSARARVAAALEEAAGGDPDFARDITELRARLDELSGRVTIDGQNTFGQLVIGSGTNIGRDNTVTTITTNGAPHPDDISAAPMWTKACLWVGGFIAVIGWFMGMAAISTQSSHQDFTSGFAVFAIGGVVIAVGELGARTTRR